MKDIKMSDVFGKEVHFDETNYTLVDPVDCGEWAEFNSKETLVAATHAINYHDSLVDQLAAAKAQYNELSSFVQSLQLDSVSDDIALEQLLAKHEGE